MNRLLYFIIYCLLLSGLYACNNGKGNNPNPQNSQLLLGKWNLQQQNLVVYVDDKEQTDTTYLASTNQVGKAWFNKNGTYSSASYLNQFPSGVPSPLNVYSAQDSTYGTYKINAQDLNLDNGIAGFDNFAYFSSTSGGAIPVISNVKRSSEVMILTSSKLNIHTELSYSISIATGSKAYKNEDDFYYTK
jgi:hypothetical protein